MFRIRIEDLPFIRELTAAEEELLFGGSRAPANNDSANNDSASSDQEAAARRRRVPQRHRPLRLGQGRLRRRALRHTSS